MQKGVTVNELEYMADFLREGTKTASWKTNGFKHLKQGKNILGEYRKQHVNIEE